MASASAGNVVVRSVVNLMKLWALLTLVQNRELSVVLKEGTSPALGHREVRSTSQENPLAGPAGRGGGRFPGQEFLVDCTDEAKKRSAFGATWHVLTRPLRRAPWVRGRWSR